MITVSPAFPALERDEQHQMETEIPHRGWSTPVVMGGEVG
jgi:hypothetical protein